jgi:hypothetical protein
MGLTKPTHVHVPHHRTRDQVIAEAERLGHELIERARALHDHTSPHPRLALEQLEAELELAAHLAIDVKNLLSNSSASGRHGPAGSRG